MADSSLGASVTACAAGHVNEFMPSDPNACDLCRSSGSASCSLAPVGRYGHAECDPAPQVWRDALEMMRRVAPSPDIVLAGGDWLGHIPPAREGRRAVRTAAVLMARLLHEAFPHAPTAHALGNHDTFPYYSQVGIAPLTPLEKPSSPPSAPPFFYPPLLRRLHHLHCLLVAGTHVGRSGGRLARQSWRDVSAAHTPRECLAHVAARGILCSTSRAASRG